MKLADYRCTRCGYQQERDCSSEVSSNRPCPRCDQRMQRRVTFAGLLGRSRGASSEQLQPENERGNSGDLSPPPGTNYFDGLSITNCGGIEMQVRGGAVDIRNGEFANNAGGDIVAYNPEHLSVTDSDFN